MDEQAALLKAGHVHASSVVRTQGYEIELARVSDDEEEEVSSN